MKYLVYINLAYKFAVFRTILRFNFKYISYMQNAKSFGLN